MRTGSFSEYENRSSSQIECQVRTFIPVSMTNGLRTGAGFQQVGENRPTLDCKLYNRWVLSYWEYRWGTSLGTYGKHDGNTRKLNASPCLNAEPLKPRCTKGQRGVQIHPTAPFTTHMEQLWLKQFWLVQ
jgi:hypothetical protein